MPTIRIGYSSDFSINSNGVGIGTTFAAANTKLDVVGALKGDFNVTGVMCLPSDQSLYFDLKSYQKRKTKTCTSLKITIHYFHSNTIMSEPDIATESFRIQTCNKSNDKVMTITAASTIQKQQVDDEKEDESIGTDGTVGIVLGCLAFFLIPGILFVRLRKTKKKPVKVEKVVQDDNPYYGCDDYGENYEMNEIKDANEAYNNDDGDSDTEVNDKNGYYED